MKSLKLLAVALPAVLLIGCASSQGGKAGAPASSSSASGSASTSGAATSDSAITDRVKAALAADSDLTPFKINVSTAQGVVSLKGEIKTLALRRKAESAAAAVSGVKSVNNQLVITG